MESAKPSGWTLRSPLQNRVLLIGVLMYLTSGRRCGGDLVESHNGERRIVRFCARSHVLLH